MGCDSKTELLLKTYPRSRPVLPPEQKETYVEHYRSNRSGREGLAKIGAKLESWMHRQVAEGVDHGILLEIGAGNLNHAPYLVPGCICDAVEPFSELWKDSPYRSHMRRIYSDLGEISEGSTYDCIFSVAVLEHLTDLPFILAHAGLLLREGGTFRAGFPSEGGLLWGTSWRLTTGVEYRFKRRQNYAALMRHEHINTADEILCLLNYFYEDLAVSRFPFLARHFSFYTAIVASKPHIDRCEKFKAVRSQTNRSAHEL